MTNNKKTKKTTLEWTFQTTNFSFGSLFKKRSRKPILHKPRQRLLTVYDIICRGAATGLIDRQPPTYSHRCAKKQTMAKREKKNRRGKPAQVNNTCCWSTPYRRARKQDVKSNIYRSRGKRKKNPPSSSNAHSLRLQLPVKLFSFFLSSFPLPTLFRSVPSLWGSFIHFQGACQTSWNRKQ